MTTVDRRLLPSDADAPGYRRIVVAPGEPHLIRSDPLVVLPDDWREHVVPLLVLVQLSDLHVMDAQSPARFELLDRFADPGSPWREGLPEIGMYRPQEAFTTQVVEAMVHAVNAVPVGPVSGVPIELAVVTGDMVDNAQANELHNYIGLLDGGAQITPGSGDQGRWEGVGGALDDDERYWHPGGDCDDLATQRGLPLVAGVLDAATRPFVSTGLTAPWLAVHGNHDLLIQGTVPPCGRYADISTGASKAVAPPVDLHAAYAVELLYDCEPEALDLLAGARAVTVTPDPDRRHVMRREHIAAHLASPGRPPGHGYTSGNVENGTAYYAWDTTRIRCIMLDTVNEHGGWQGSIDRGQLAWLISLLEQSDDRPVVMFSHHPLETLTNGSHPADVPSRVLAAELRELLLGYPCVIAWVNGHTHEHRVQPMCRDDGSVAWWQITTASHIDWPQQSRVIEVLAVGDLLVIASTVIDSAGHLDWAGHEGPLALAGLSREVAANNWQAPAGTDGNGAGTAQDRNVILVSRLPS